MSRRYAKVNKVRYGIKGRPLLRVQVLVNTVYDTGNSEDLTPSEARAMAAQLIACAEEIEAARKAKVTGQPD